MEEHNLVNAVKNISAKDARYAVDAYFFVIEALDSTARTLQRAAKEGSERHVSGQELSEGIRKFALQQFGPMSRTVLRSWGLNRTEDFGEIVYNLIEAGKLRKTEGDRKEDFANGFDFEEAFTKPFQPRAEQVRPARSPQGRRKRRSPA